eukprot:TRINITY_DN71291_c0_g1_i1.p1 TRINITY_DN71291_c0_g1~~TRINITY_DN71291_c0_g1_i1.p1  ORF type:complete len:961 (-),score=118.54 TRINITY_DN71291_c0_g1_i1:21-2903(-)
MGDACNCRLGVRRKRLAWLLRYDVAATFVVLVLASTSGGVGQREKRSVSRDVDHDIHCFAAEHEISWLRVRKHFWRHFFAFDADADTDVFVLATRTIAAIEADAELPAEAVRGVLQGDLAVHCQVGKAVLRLAVCLRDASTDRGELCSQEAIDPLLKLLLGTSEALTLERVVQSGWPAYHLIAAIISRSTPHSVNDARQHLLAALSAYVGQSEGSSGFEQHLPNVLLALQRACPYREPFDQLLCGHQSATSKAPGEASFASAASDLAVAVRLAFNQLQASSNEPCASPGLVATGKVYSDQLPCYSGALLNADIEKALSRVEAALSSTLAAAGEGSLAVESLALSIWPVSNLLASLSDAVWGQRRDMTWNDAPIKQGICACSVDGWLSREVESVAAAARMLDQLQHRDGDISKILEVARSPDSELACFNLPGHTMSSLDVTMSTTPRKLRLTGVAMAVLKRVWGVMPLYYDEINGNTLRQEDVLRKVEWLRLAGHEDFDTGVCIPGALAVATACALTALERNAYHVSIEFTVAMEIFLMGTLPCVTALGDGPPRSPKEQVTFEGAWPGLAPWLRDPRRFMERVWGPLLSSNMWWLGANSSNGISEDLQDDLRAKAANSCDGIWDDGARQRCVLESSRSGTFEPVLLNHSESTTEMPATRIMGVGPMKSGSTAVVQALGAALRWSVGFDCKWTASNASVSRILRRQESKNTLLGACSKDLFRWQVIKDPMLTPLAARLSTIWPATSAHGLPLKLYFLVRNPFDCVRSFVQHLRLPLLVDPSDPMGQHFALERMPHASRFTRGKQLYMDVTRDGLRYTGYIDSVIQRWVLSVDEYLRCPSRFALIRYEDFATEPVRATRLLLQELGFGHIWDEGAGGAAERVANAAKVRYQSQNAPLAGGASSTGDLVDLFGAAMFARLQAAVESRALLLGYGYMLLKPDASQADPHLQAIDVPSLPVTSCGV